MHFKSRFIMPRQIGLATNFLTHIMRTGYISYENFTGAALDAVAGGITAVPPFVTNVTPPVSHGADQALGEEETRFAKVLFVDQPRIR
jgi:hypothetical protein